jgi:hypothetical protein
MEKAFYIASPRYKIKGVKGEVFDVFKQRVNAIKASIKLASEYPGTTFLVVKKVVNKETIIFSVNLAIKFEFEDLQDVYQSLISNYEKKLKKTKYWRKDDNRT